MPSFYFNAISSDVSQANAADPGPTDRNREANRLKKAFRDQQNAQGEAFRLMSMRRTEEWLHAHLGKGKGVVAKPPKLSEKLFQQRIVDGARALGWMVYFTWKSFHSPKGFLDLVLCHPKRQRLMFVEVKTDTGKVTPEQQAWIMALRDCGQLAYVVRPGDWDAWFWKELSQ